MNEILMRALDVAAEQNAVITRRQARFEGMTDHMVDTCIANGMLMPISGHVFRVRGAPQNAAMAITSAVLSAGGRASHATAERLLKLQAALPVNPIHVTVDGRHQRPRVTRLEVADERHAFFGVRVHRYTEMEEPSTTIDGVPCVDAARALIDLAPRLSDENLENAFERARKLGLVSTESLASARLRVAGTLGRVRDRRFRVAWVPGAVEAGPHPYCGTRTPGVANRRGHVGRRGEHS